MRQKSGPPKETSDQVVKAIRRAETILAQALSRILMLYHLLLTVTHGGLPKSGWM